MPNSREYHQAADNNETTAYPTVHEQFSEHNRPKPTSNQACVVGFESKSEDSFYSGILFKKCLLPKFCHGKIFLIALFCLAIVGQGMIVSGQLPITLSMLEKNFGYNSVETGIIHSCYDAFFGISSVLVGLFGRKRKVMVIGIGIFIIAIGCFTFTIPHFLYNYQSTVENADRSSIISHYTEYDVCDEGRTKIEDPNRSNTLSYLAIFCLSYCLIGIGAAPLHTLTVVYMDERLTPHMNGIFLGVYYFFGAVGPALGFGLGYPFLNYNVTLVNDLDSTLTPDSEGWIGAWWIGYILGGCLLTLVSIPIVLYPSVVTIDLRENCLDKDQKQFRNGIKGRALTQIHLFIDYFKSFGSLSKNIPYILLISGMTIEGIVLNGLGTFLSKASLLSGALAVVGAGTGLLLSGILMKKFESKKSKAILITIISLVSALLFGSFFFGCGSRNIEKIILNNKFEILDELLDCHEVCNCFSDKYEPVCDVTSQTTYFSPCKAGCITKHITNDKLIFQECSCARSMSTELEQGGCKPECKMLYWFMPFAFMAFFTTFFIYVPQITLTLQLLDDNTKNLGTGLQQILIRIGFIVAPIIYGCFLDSSCILWSAARSDSNISNCLEYNNPKMRLYISLSSIIIKLTATACYILSSHFIRDDPKEK